ncbi:AraC family transcriptional regulator [Curtobacterium flaccumfaciens]|uniref:AraC family transcriptional regulator n=1 Tax=Curtobacterium flaccumfaciens TaxID=2035 RepID=UPI001ADA5987|nr:helix-turn-helix domain-containing protein [Curtobacterium flaccumfaciens]MBO9038307.1 AraC family transcriptional regulator [Curtobacterium flaccumfaciens pv. flaccumfaciens]
MFSPYTTNFTPEIQRLDDSWSSGSATFRTRTRRLSGAVRRMFGPMSDETSPTIRIEHRGIDVDEAVAFYEWIYASHDIHVGDAATEGFSWRYRAVGDDDVVMGTSMVSARRWGTINPGRQYILAWASGPGITLDTGSRTPVPMLPGVPTMYPAGREFTFDALPTTQHLIRFDGAFLEAVAAARAQTVPAPLRFEAITDPAVLQRLRTTITAVAPQLLNPALDQASRSASNVVLAEAVSDAFRAFPALDMPLLAGPATMRLAQEWMVANAHRSITITDVCAAAGVAVRSLQSSFQRHAGRSPMHFLREVRLYRVRAALSAADADITTVGEIARAWGFQHLGRFAGYYAGTFGEPPSTTLRRRPSP